MKSRKLAAVGTAPRLRKSRLVFGSRDVVPHPPQSLISSSGGTTSAGSDGPPSAGTWCSTARNPLFLRPEAPRFLVRMGLRRPGRGAPLPANPCFFVRKHHVGRVGWVSGGWDVVHHRPQTLVPSSGGTTLAEPDGMRWETAASFPFLFI